MSRFSIQFSLYDLAADDSNHLLLQCPALQDVQHLMFQISRDIPDGFGIVALDDVCDVITLLLCRRAGFPDSPMQVT